MIDYTTYVVDKYCRKGIIVDTNVMLVYIVGIYGHNYLPKFKRTRGYDREVFEYIYSVLAQFRRHIITPHILTELSNLSPKIRDNKQDNKLAAYFTVFKDVLERASERYINKDNILNSTLLPKLGVTDLTIIEAAEKYKCLVFTDDGPATGCMRHKGIEVLNLKEIRTALWMRK